MLTNLPPEILSLILSELSSGGHLKGDLKAVSLVSKRLHAAVAERLWQVITLRPPSEYDLHRLDARTLPQACLQLARELHFRSSFSYSIQDRCPHSRDYYLDDTPSGFSFEGEDEDEDLNLEPFELLAQKTMAVLRRLKDNQLHSFSWDLGTCVPSEILGDRGIIPLKQPLLRSLSLTTNALCFGDGDVEPVDLSSFHHLQSLCWRAIHGRDVDALYLVIQLNKSRLRTLELDFVNWQKFLDYQDLSSDEEDGNDEGTSMANSFFADHILCLDRRRPRQLLPQLRVLNLTQVALVGAMAHAINFDTLRSLTLRMCPGWTDFVKTALQLKVSLRLITLEIQDTDAVSISGEYVIRDLINEFTGLEELFISQTGPVETLDLWKTIARCHPTLRRLVHHQRTINTDWEDPNFEEEVDLDDLAIFGREGRIMKEDPLRNNPLARLDLDCIGLCCRPNRRLKHILLPYRVIPSLKLLHIRQSAADLKLYASWFQGNSPPMVSLATTGEDPQVTEEENEEESNSGREDSMAPSWADSGPPSPIDDTEDAAFNPDDDENAAVAESGRLNWPKLLPETQRFASWAFGPHGIPSLQIIAFGDYAHGGRATSNRFFLCRCTEEGRRFRYLSEYDRMGKELYLEYRNVLQACPVEPLLGQE